MMAARFAGEAKVQGPEAIIDAVRRAPAIVVPLVREVPPPILKRIDL